jgi:Zn-dependent protease
MMMDGAQAMSTIIQALLWYAVLLFSLCIHEASHAYAALIGGDPTGWRSGQVTLNPLPHIRREPVGTVWAPLLSFFMMGWMFGWASTPYDLGWSERYPRRSALMALAGPLANGLVMVVSFALLRWGLMAGIFSAPTHFQFDQVVMAVQPEWQGACRLLSVMFFLNLILVVFNLIPLPPMDGSSVVGLFLPEKMLRPYRVFTRKPGLSWLGLIVAWFFFGSLFRPVMFWAMGLLFRGL